LRVGELVGAAEDVQVGADGVRVVGQAVTGSVLAVQVVAGPADQHIGLPGGLATRVTGLPVGFHSQVHRQPDGRAVLAGQRAVHGGVAADVGQP
jgi:hypothetical protein